MMSQLAVGSQMGGGRVCSLLNIVRLRARNTFWRAVLHCDGIGFMKTLRVYMKWGGGAGGILGKVGHAWLSEGALG